MTLEELRTELAPIRTELASIRAELRVQMAAIRSNVDLVPAYARSVAVLQEDVRSLRAAFHDFSLTQTTAGEIETLKTELKRVQTENAELATKVTTLERLMRELQK